MKQLKEEHVDLLIKEAIHNEINNTLPPPITTDEAWRKLQYKLNEERPRSKRFQFLRNKFFYSAAALFIVLLMLFAPENSSAYSKFIEVFQKVQGNIVQLFGSVGNPDIPKEDAPTTDEIIILDESETFETQLSLEKAQKETAFMINIPKAVPEGITLRDVTISKAENQASQDITLNYEGNGHSFNLNQRSVGDSLGFGAIVDSDKAQVKSVDINGYSADLLLYQDGFSELIWLTESYYYSISGTLTESEVLEIARSI